MNPQPTDKTLILASSSPRRKVLMTQAGLVFRTVSPPIPEPNELEHGLTPTGQAEALAYFKASSVQRGYADDTILGADTIVAAGGEILGKARDAKGAGEMLAKLSGTQHEVITGVALLGPGHRRIIASDVTRITMRTITQAEINAYVDSGEWEGKAGSYAIQETGDRFVVNIEGSFSNVVGLPMELLGRMLTRFSQVANHQETGD